MELFTPGHLVVLAILALVLFFGWKQMPDMARSLGRSLRVFKTEIKGLTGDDKAREDAANQTAAQLPPPVAPPAIANTAPPATVPVRTDAASGAIAGDVARSRPRPAPRPTRSDSAAGTK
jgi:sec-independent protein translocase protein TatA